MTVPTEIRVPPITSKKPGTMLLPKTEKPIPLVVMEGEKLFYVEGSGNLREAKDLDPMPISELPFSVIPHRLLGLIAAKRLSGGKIILYTRN